MNVLTIETTCDETAAAVVNENREVLGSVVASQNELHERFLGVVPEVASRAHMERILPVIAEALSQAKLTPADLSAVAAAVTPGLAGSLLVGVAAAKGLAVALDIPFVAINHLQAHIYACRIAFGPDVFPCVGLIVSGGHSNLYRCLGPLDFELLGATIDDAAGEAFDKVANLLGLPFPGGPSIERTAKTGDPQKYRFPRSLMDDPDRLEFSFSGLKTAVRYQLAKLHPEGQPDAPLVPEVVADVAASFQEAAVDALVGKTIAAMKHTKLKTVCVGGGVAANKRFREKLQAAVVKARGRLFMAPPHLCTDNAVMGAIAVEHLLAGQPSPLDADVSPGLIRSPRR